MGWSSKQYLSSCWSLRAEYSSTTESYMPHSRYRIPFGSPQANCERIPFVACLCRFRGVFRQTGKCPSKRISKCSSRKWGWISSICRVSKADRFFLRFPQVWKHGNFQSFWWKNVCLAKRKIWVDSYIAEQVFLLFAGCQGRWCSSLYSGQAYIRNPRSLWWYNGRCVS